MADLTNSKRLNYKATYNQINPGIYKEEEAKNPNKEAEAKNPNKEEETKNPKPPKNPVNNLKRAIEKTVFVQSLKIKKSELFNIKEKMLGRYEGNQRKEVLDMFDAIELLVMDDGNSSTQKYSQYFANVDYKRLVEFSGLIIERRSGIAKDISKTIEDIVAGNTVTDKNPEASTDQPEKITEETKVVRTTNSLGRTIQTTISPLKKTVTEVKGEKVKGRSRIIQSFLEDSNAALPSGSKEEVNSPGLNPVVRLFLPEIIARAEREQPKLFDHLYDLTKPYFLLRKDQFSKKERLVSFFREGYETYFNEESQTGEVSGFESRMHVEPVGFLHLERIEMYPVGIERGELVHAVPLAPSETVNISHKEWSVKQQEFEDIVQDYFEGYSEEGVAEKTDVALSNESQSKHATALNIGASLSASYSSVTLSTSFGYNATTDDQQSRKDSRNHSMTLTKKASARTKKDHKVTFKVSSVTGSQDESVRLITNPSDTDAMRIDYFQMARKWKVNLLRYGLRMTYDIVIPDPGSALITKLKAINDLDRKIDEPFVFDLPLDKIYYYLNASHQLIHNYDTLAAQYGATIEPPPPLEKSLHLDKIVPEIQSPDDIHSDNISIPVDEGYGIGGMEVYVSYQINDNDYWLQFYNDDDVFDKNDTTFPFLQKLLGATGNVSQGFEFKHLTHLGIGLIVYLRLLPETFLAWRFRAWSAMRQAAEDRFYNDKQVLKDRRAKLIEEINQFDGLTLRRMEQEEIMKGVLRWIFGPNFYIVPSYISSLFGSDSNDPGVEDVLDPNQMSLLQWKNVLEHGEFIKYVHNAIEWENVLYFNFPYFWDNNLKWNFKKFLHHPDLTHRTFLRSGAARVVLTIRPGFEDTFTQLVENGIFLSLPGPHPYVTIAEEIQNFAKTNYPGFPPANPEQNARPLLYVEQRKVWKEMQYIIQLLEAYKVDPANNGHFPDNLAGSGLPAAAINQYRDGPISIKGLPYNGVNGYNKYLNDKQLALDPATPLQALLPIYTNVPVNDLWGNPYHYNSPGLEGDYDLISFGADGRAGGEDKDADISANCEASLISTWFEYTPVNALDIGISMNKPNITPPALKPDLA